MELLQDDAPAFIRRTFGHRYDLAGLPWDLSHQAAQRLPATKEWAVEVGADAARQGRTGRVWRVIAAPGQAVPDDFRFRGRLVIVTAACPRRKRDRTVRTPTRQRWGRPYTLGIGSRHPVGLSWGSWGWFWVRGAGVGLAIGYLGITKLKPTALPKEVAREYAYLRDVYPTSSVYNIV